MRWPEFGNIRTLIIAIYITIVVFLINFVLVYVEKTYHIVLAYSSYVFTLAQVISTIALGYALISIMSSVLVRYTSRRLDKVGTEIVKFFGQVIAYVILLLIIFDILQINPSSLLAASAIGGVIVGLALQNLMPIMFSGVLIGSSRTLTTGEVVVMESYYWGANTPKLLKVKKVGIIFTQFHDSAAHLVTIPNTMLLSASVSTRLENRGVFKHFVNVNVINDVRGEVLDKYLNKSLKEAFLDSDLEVPHAYLSQNNDKTRIYSVTFFFNDIYEVDGIYHKIFNAVDKAYWQAKEKSKSRRRAA